VGFWGRSSGDGATWGGVSILRQGDINIFEDSSGSNAFYALGGFYEVITGEAGLFTAQSVGENQGLGELTSAHYETGAVDGPLFGQIRFGQIRFGEIRFSTILVGKIHSAFFHPGRGRNSVLVFGRVWLALGEYLAASGVTLRAQMVRVNYTLIVQRWNFSSETGGDESG
jgi:hypothetical protein